MVAWSRRAAWSRRPGRHPSTRRAAPPAGRAWAPPWRSGVATSYTRRRTGGRSRTTNVLSLRAPCEDIEHAAHAVDLGGLVGVHVGSESEDRAVFRGAGGGEQLGDHRERAAVVLNHEREEEAVELLAPRGGQLGAPGRGERARAGDWGVQAPRTAGRWGARWAPP